MKKPPSAPDISNCLAWQKRAQARIPGMTQLLSKRPDQFSLGVWPGYYSSAKGCELVDCDGNRYTDMSIGGIGANILGYADPDVDNAVTEAIRNGSSTSLNCVEEVELAELLCELHPWAEMARFTRSGGEAMAVAVRIARAATGRDVVAFCGYHGWHDWYLAANLGTENALVGHLLPGLDPAGVPRGLAGTAIPFAYGDIDALRAIVQSRSGEIAAICMESIRNEPPTREFLEQAAKLARESGAVLIVDEISAGFRLNTGGAHMVLGLSPDIAVFSKALGNGYPIGAVIGSREIMQNAQRTFISSTCWTERTGPAAALATIRKHRDQDVPGHLRALGDRMQAGWRRLFARHGIPATVRGIAPLSHFAFQHPDAPVLKALFVQGMLDRGFLASNSFYAMHAHRTEHVDAYLEAADEVLGTLAAALHQTDPDRHLRGAPSAAGFKRLT